jgi:small subunit ribosomal protein S6
MAFYEAVFIARQDLTPAQVETLSGTVSDLIKTNGGSVTKTEQWGLRALAYRMNKNKKGHYVLMNIDAPSAAISEMERNMRINEDVLRYLTVRVDALEEGPSSFLRRRDEEPREGDRGFGNSFGGPRRSGGGDRGGDRGFRPRPPRDASPESGEQA